jgi:hypothetical protein
MFMGLYILDFERKWNMSFSVDNKNSFGLATTNRVPEFQILLSSYPLPLVSPKSSVLKIQKSPSDINII